MQRFFRCLLTGLFFLVLPTAWAADDFLPPEQAFKVSAQMVAVDRIEVLVRIAPGYYAYREPLRFTAQGAELGTPEVPQGKVKFDENFQKNVETYRNDLRIPMPVRATAPFKLTVVAQGCADAGLCYPPLTTEIPRLTEPFGFSAATPDAGRRSAAPQPSSKPLSVNTCPVTVTVKVRRLQ